MNISAQAEEILRRRAARAGMEVATYVAREVERLAARWLTVADISGPANAEFTASGMTDEQLGRFLEDAKHEMRGDKNGRA